MIRNITLFIRLGGSQTAITNFETHSETCFDEDSSSSAAERSSINETAIDVTK